MPSSKRLVTGNQLGSGAFVDLFFSEYALGVPGEVAPGRVSKRARVRAVVEVWQAVKLLGSTTDTYSAQDCCTGATSPVPGAATWRRNRGVICVTPVARILLDERTLNSRPHQPKEAV